MLRSDRSQIFVLKYWPLIFSVGVAFVFWKTLFHWKQLLFLVAIFLLAVFRASLAVIEIPDGAIRYRRLSNWKELLYDEIVRCGVSRAGIGIGYISLRRFLWPWGKLYFILDEQAGRGREPLLTFIQERIGQKYPGMH